MLKQQIAYLSIKKKGKRKKKKEARRCYTHLLLYFKGMWVNKVWGKPELRDFIYVSPSRKIDFTHANLST
jgi:hypothetical protein